MISILYQTSTPGVITSTKQNCIPGRNESTTLIPSWNVNIRNNENPNNPVGAFNKLNKQCDIICNKQVIGKAPVCDPPSNARTRVLYPSSVNNNPNKMNTPRYYEKTSSYLQSRCKSYPGSFIREKDNKITILDCENNEVPGKTCFTDKTCSTKFYKTSNPKFSQNTSVKSSTGLLRKKYNTLRGGNLNSGQGLSNFDNPTGSSMCCGSRRDVPFLIKTTSQGYSNGAKIDPVKCHAGFYRKPGNFVTSCMDNKYGKTIGHMQLDITTKRNVDKNSTAFYSTNHQPQLKRSKHISAQLTIKELAALYGVSSNTIKNLT